MINLYDDNYFMRRALDEAKIAFQKDEVPVGAVIVSNNQIIARAHNLTETLNDVTAHAEMQCITSAANYIGGKYLKNCTCSGDERAARKNQKQESSVQH